MKNTLATVPLRSPLTVALIWLTILLAATRVAVGETPAPHPSTSLMATRPTEDTAVAQPQLQLTPTKSTTTARLREGWQLTDQLGEFQKMDAGISFRPQGGKQALQVLENLALERIVRLIDEDSSPRQWSVSGLVTEFHGENYLLITRALVKPRVARASSPTAPTKRTADTEKKPGGRSGRHEASQKLSTQTRSGSG